MLLHRQQFTGRRRWLSSLRGGGGSPALFQLTAVKRMGRLPLTATPPVNMQTQEYDSYRRRAALIARDDFLRKVHAFSRVNFDIQQRPQVHAYLSEALSDKRMSDLPAKTVHVMLHLAFVAGLHDLGLALYHAKRQQNARSRGVPSTVAAPAGSYESELTSSSAGEDGGETRSPIAHSPKTVNNFLVPQYVVDSAYATENVVELLRIASYCAKCARDDEAAGMSPAVMTVFSLFRCLWRVVCLSEHFLRGEVAGTHAAASTSVEALEAARLMLTDYIIPFVEANGRDGQPLPHHGHHCIDTAGAWQRPTARLSRDGKTTALRGKLTESTVDAFLRAVQRAVKYDTSGDDGEMFFYRHCVRTGCLVVPPLVRAQGQLVTPAKASEVLPFSQSASQPFSLVDDGAATDLREDYTLLSSSAGSGGLMNYANDRELFYAALIDSCAAGRHVGAAMGYFHEACAASIATATAAANTQHTRPTSVPQQHQQPPLSEYVLYRLLAVLQQRRDNKRIIQLARSLLLGSTASPPVTSHSSSSSTSSPLHAVPASPPAAIGISVWSAFLIAAGELRAVDVALTAYRYAQDRARKASPSTNERRSFEYLLQTALNALSKCQLTHYEEEYLIPAQEAGMLHCTREFYFCCLLQDAHNSMNPAERAEAICARMEEEGVDASVAVYTRLLKLYLRCESPLLLPAYKRAVATYGLARRAWLDELVVWADRRRYFLTQADRAFILREVSKANNGGGEKADHSFMGGLRTQLALLEHDYAVQPLEHFATHRAPPPTPPTVLDSRAHFLLKGGQRVLQGVSAGGGDESVNHRPGEALTVHPPAARMVLGDTARLSSLAGKATLAGVAPLLLSQASSDDSIGAAAGGRAEPSASAASALWEDEAMRLYLGEMLTGLQRSCNRVT